MSQTDLCLRELTAATWSSFETLFGEKGACGGCWCSLWRRPKKDFDQGKTGGNKDWMYHLVQKGEVPGLLFFQDDLPVAWLSLGPRDQFDYLTRSRVLLPVDDQPVWSISCFYVDKTARGKGLTPGMLEMASDYAYRQGAHILEGYPIDPNKPKMPAVFVWTGLLRSYQKAGFKEVARNSETRPIMRKILTPHA